MTRAARIDLILALLIAGAVGASLFCGAIVAPAIFRAMPGDMHDAGMLAAHVFAFVDWMLVIVACCALAAIVLAPAATHTRSPLRRGIKLLLCLIVLAVGLAQRRYFAPAIVAHGTGWPGSFASLHATAGALDLVSLIALVGLSWLLARGAARGVEPEPLMFQFP